MNWHQLHTIATSQEREQIAIELLSRTQGRSRQHSTRTRNVAIGMASFILLSAAGLRPGLPAVIVDLFIVILVSDLVLLAFLLVRRVPAPQALLSLFAASAVLMYFIIATALAGSNAPKFLMIAAGYGIALCATISAYLLAQLVKVNLVVKIA